MNHTVVVAATNSWEIGTTIIRAFEAGGLSLALVIFMVWLIRTVIKTILESRRSSSQNECEL